MYLCIRISLKFYIIIIIKIKNIDSLKRNKNSYFKKFILYNNI